MKSSNCALLRQQPRAQWSSKHRREKRRRQPPVIRRQFPLGPDSLHGSPQYALLHQHRQIIRQNRP
jgi:hypothetical protein